ncbi:hypothetical protein B0H17DRAFT_1134299 [Mycena rosella]|uniref:Uncharacterized protein n=1 Tax=Mycena rosella TaxID=1033263 RepID=A0AAD7DG82_MYCRO|nr:hypothetical protein B0H17DRAFT_1134299 [Mycena rosella]
MDANTASGGVVAAGKDRIRGRRPATAGAKRRWMRERPVSGEEDAHARIDASCIVRRGWCRRGRASISWVGRSEGVRGGAGVGGAGACGGIVELELEKCTLEYDEMRGVRACGACTVFDVQELYPEGRLGGFFTGGALEDETRGRYIARAIDIEARQAGAGGRDEPITHHGPSNDPCVQLQVESAENQLEGGGAAVVTRETDPQSTAVSTRRRAHGATTGPAGEIREGHQ